MANKKLMDELKMLKGLPPYDDWSNICYGDGYFWKSIQNKYTEKQIAEAEKELGIKKPKQKGENMIIEEKVDSWISQKNKLNRAKKYELELRKEICDHILQGKIKGSKKGTIGKYILTASAKLNIKVDAELLESMWEELSEREKACIKYKPNIIAAEYKKLKGGVKLNRCIDSKPGTPTLTLKSIK